MTVLRLALSFFVAMCAVAGQSAAQSLAPKDLAGSDAIAALPQLDRDEYYKKRKEALRRLMPRIVFVPGILGSEIEECQADESQCRPIWGTIEAFRSDLDLTVKTDREYRTDVIEELVLQDVYGDLLDGIRNSARRIIFDNANDPALTVVHYDWRQSNAQSAETLAERICQVRLAAPDSPIVVIAHSMGGLITKLWAKEHAEKACGPRQKPDVRSIVFVATPHLGAPKTFTAVRNGYSLLFDELTMIRGLLPAWARMFERDYVLGNLNRAGMYFSSFYELMPIQSSEWCRAQKPGLADTTVIPQSVVDADGNPVNLFDPDKWKQYDLLRDRIPSKPQRRSFYENRLPPLLRNAEILLCNLVDFDPSSVADVTYYVGHLRSNTTLGLVRIKGVSGDQPLEIEAVAGDGTVPVYSARNALIDAESIKLDSDHVSIVNQPVIIGSIQRMFQTADAESKKLVLKADARFRPLVAIEVASTGQLLPVSADPAQWTTLDQQEAIAVNAEALKLRGTSPAAVAHAASTLFHSERAKLLAVAASSTSSSSDKVRWTEQMAKASYISNDYDDALAASDYVLASAPTVFSDDSPELTSLKSSAKSINAWANLKKGHVDKYQAILAADKTLKEPHLSPSDYPPIMRWAGSPDNTYVMIGGQAPTGPGAASVFEQIDGRILYGPQGVPAGRPIIVQPPTEGRM